MAKRFVPRQRKGVTKTIKTFAGAGPHQSPATHYTFTVFTCDRSAAPAKLQLQVINLGRNFSACKTDRHSAVVDCAYVSRFFHFSLPSRVDVFAGSLALSTLDTFSTHLCAVTK